MDPRPIHRLDDRVGRTEGPFSLSLLRNQEAGLLLINCSRWASSNTTYYSLIVNIISQVISTWINLPSSRRNSTRIKLWYESVDYTSKSYMKTTFGPPLEGWSTRCWSPRKTWNREDFGLDLKVKTFQYWTFGLSLSSQARSLIA